MRSLFSNTLHQAELQLLKSRKETVEEQILQLDQTIDGLTQKANSLESQIVNSNIELDKLSSAIEEKTQLYNLKQQAISEAKQKSNPLDAEYRLLMEKSEALIKSKEHKEYAIKVSKETIEQIKGELKNIDLEEQRLSHIIFSPEPKPKYSTTGGTCIHGHVNCQNLPIVNPGKTTLLNEAEIKDHQTKVSLAKHAQMNLVAQKNQIIEKLNNLSAQLRQFEFDVIILQTEYWQCLNQAQSIKQKMENDSSLLQMETEAKTLSEEIKTFENRNALLKNELITLNSQLQDTKNLITENIQKKMIFETEIQSLKNEVEALNQKINKFLETRRAQQLEALARKQLGLEALAVMEYQNEKKESTVQATNPENSSLQSKADDLAEKLIDKAIKAAHKAGAISEQVKKNLLLIKNVGKEVLDHANQDLDTFKIFRN